jgi:hypothetical protein
MVIKSITSFIGKRELAAWGILASCFVALIAFQMNVWGFVVVSMLFIGYISWTATAFLVNRQDFSRRKVMAWALPVCLAMLQALVCLGLAALILWVAHRLFRF